MKTIESSLIGRRNIAAADPNVQLFQVREVLNQHRDRLINRLLVDIPTYLDFRFKARASTAELSGIRESLLDITKTNIDLDRYNTVVRQILRRPRTRLTNDAFFAEIDELIKRKITRQQLTLIA